MGCKFAMRHAGQTHQHPAAIALHAQAFVDFFFGQRAGDHDQPVCAFPVSCHAQTALRAHGPGVNAGGVTMLVHAACDSIKRDGDQLGLEAIGALSRDGVGRITHVVEIVEPGLEPISQMQ